MTTPDDREAALAVERRAALDEPLRAQHLYPFGDLALRARALRDYGGSADMAGDYERAERAYTQSGELFREIGDERGAAEAVWGATARARSDFADFDVERAKVKNARFEAPAEGLQRPLVDFKLGAALRAI
jgi:hypothetical protein